LVELHGGTIRVHSEGEGKGAVFYVFLPDRESANPTAPTAALRKRSDPVFPAATALSGLRVLVVDDEPDSLDLVSTIVQQHGGEVRRAASAGEAMSLLQQIPFDLVVSDIAMPDEDGYSLIKRIRSRTDLQSLPAVALTAYASPADQWQALESGYDDHLSKPVEPANLVTRLARLAQKD
jgi:CheY-like chemotaxis protein